MMKLSIVIPVYNTEAYLARCLDSCLSQDIPAEDYEIVVVNDGSTDGSLAIAEKYASDHGNIRIVSQANAGLSCARNSGLKAACGDYVWFVDSDDYIAADCLGELLSRCSGQALDFIAMCRVDVMDDGRKAVQQYYGDSLSSVVLSGPEAMRRGLLKSPCAVLYMIRRQYLLEQGLSFCPGLLHEDEEFTPRLFYQASRVSFSSHACYCYYVCVRPGSIMQTPNPKRLQDMMKIVGMHDEYSRSIDAGDRYLFSRSIAVVLDSCMKLCRKFPKGSVDWVYDQLSEKKKTVGAHLRNCRIAKFQFAGVLFSIHPKLYFALYRLYALIHR